MAAGVVFAVFNAPSLLTAAGRIGTIAAPAASVGVGLSAAAMVNRGRLNHLAHAAVGARVPLASTVRAAAVAFAANKVAKSAGLSGFAVFVRHGRRHRCATVQVVAACTVASVCCFAALGVLLGAAFAVLAVRGALEGWWLAAACGYAASAVGVALAIGLVLHSRRGRRLACVGWVRGRTRLAHALRRRRAVAPTASVTEAGSGPAATAAAVAAAEAWAEGLRAITGQALRRPGTTAAVLAHAVASKVLGAAMLAAAAAAVRAGLPLESVLLAYGASLAASSASLLPGGLGTVEASLGGVLVAAGVPGPTAVLTVALYRVFDLWLPVAVGAALGRRELRAAAGREAASSGPVARRRAGLPGEVPPPPAGVSVAPVVA